MFESMVDQWRGSGIALLAGVCLASPAMTATMYIRKLMQQDVKPGFQDVYREALQKKVPNPPPVRAN